MMLQIPFVGNRNFQSCGEIESMHEFEVYAELYIENTDEVRK